jgi:serine/threonine protein kinase
MGEVYCARDTKLNRDVAIKVLPDVFAADRERLARFEREAQLLASLNHPHIAQIYGFEDFPSGDSSLGVVMYEMLSGHRPFEGRTATDTIVAVLRRDVHWTLLPRDTPEELRRLIRRCLQRDPKDRLHDAADARLILADAEHDLRAARTGRRPWSNRTPWLGVGALTVATALVGALVARSRLGKAPDTPREGCSRTSRAATFRRAGSRGSTRTARSRRPPSPRGRSWRSSCHPTATAWPRRASRRDASSSGSSTWSGARRSCPGSTA